jgi:glycosyltransferase involved in cell wall biosynthesis
MLSNISVLILTRNEEKSLPGCLESVAWSDDVHVLDSFSTDGTVQVARAAGATVTQRIFDNYASQRNFGLKLAFEHPWLLILDADERVPPALGEELLHVAAVAPAELSGLRVKRRDYFFDTWLKRSQLSPLYIRFVRPERSRYHRAINEVLEVEGTLGDLVNPLIHFPFSKGIAQWVEKHNVYSSMEAKLICDNAGLSKPSLRAALLGPDFHTRRVHQKAIFYKLPARPLIKWVYMMFVRGAMLDGPAGVAYSTLQSYYEYLIVLKTRELQARAAKRARPSTL